ncbi:MAG TPA: chemotaxis protein CheA, partial [Kofleriaceae bacterium]|nr:chemotaxis protein CheA [Kofleriaceae bacterium]
MGSLAPAHLTTFVHEVEDLLERIEATVLALESAPTSKDLLDELFRAFHTLKGSAGVAGVTPIAKFTHHVESAMDLVRNGSVALTPALVSAVLASRDHVAGLLASALGTGTCDLAQGDAIIAQLGTITANSSAQAPKAAMRVLVQYLVTFTPTVELDADLELSGFESELAALGDLMTLDAPGRELGTPWKFLLSTTLGSNAIRDIFIFIADAGTLEIDEGASQFLDDEPAPAEVSVASAAPAASAPTRATATDSTVRVSSDRLDHLVKLIGELVITQSRLVQAHALQPSPELAGPVESFERLIGDLRDSVLGLRMVPIGTMFSRFQRLIRDLSSELAKDVQLVTSGDDTELDKTVIDKLGDALVHILRNSMDHGIESPDARLAAGKPAKSTLRLDAQQEGSYVVITITDDGRGIDLEAVRRKAEAQGIVQPGEFLSEQDTLMLITRPGFSTAQAVTQLSGRGVGMDVVKKTVEDLRGTLSIASTKGQGSEFRLRLPLTLAIIDGLLVEIAEERFIVPMAAVTENLELATRDRDSRRDWITVRGQCVPYIRMREVFRSASPPVPREQVVVVTVDGQRVGLVVDRIIGNHQTVIQPLGWFYRDVGVFSGT